MYVCLIVRTVRPDRTTPLHYGPVRGLVWAQPNLGSYCTAGPWNILETCKVFPRSTYLCLYSTVLVSFQGCSMPLTSSINVSIHQVPHRSFPGMGSI